MTEESALRTELGLLNQQKSSLQGKIVCAFLKLLYNSSFKCFQSSLQNSITKMESNTSNTRSLSRDLSTLQQDFEEKSRRIRKTQEDIANAGYDGKLQQIMSSIRSLEDKRDLLNVGLKNLSMQSEARAKLDLERGELKTKIRDLDNIVDSTSTKYNKLLGSVIKLETMERDVDDAIK